MKFLPLLGVLAALSFNTLAAAQSPPPNISREASEVYKSCSENGYQKRYYKCDCVATSFDQARKAAPAASQRDVLEKVLTSPQAGCTNVEAIAISTLMNCTKSESRFSNRTAEQSKEYCECKAIVNAREIRNKPNPAAAYNQNVLKYADATCKDPAKRAAILKPK
jgi:hypothetical protein